MGGANTGTNKIGEAQFAAGTVPKATLATPADKAAFISEQEKNKRIAEGIAMFAKGLSEIDFNNSQNKAKENKKQQDMWRQFQMANSGELNFMPVMPYQIRSTNPELISNAWANAGKTLATSALGGVGKMYGM